MSKKYKIATLGCRTNQYESLAYQNQLKKAGFEEAKEGEEANLCIINTCTVTQSADSHSRHQIRKLRKTYPQAKIVVTGCMTHQGKNELLEMKEADHIIGNPNKDQLLKQIYPELEFEPFALESLETQTRAFLKIQDGCNSFCSYCIIPYVRGRSRSKTLQEVFLEAKKLVENGVKEIVLTGINIGDFDGQDSKGQIRLCHVVEALDQLEGLKRLRISSIDPDEVDDELIQTLKNSPKACQSMHIVLQSGSNFVLKRMNRKYTRQMFFQTIDRLKSHFPNFTFTTDIIVGFPGERDVDFEETLDVVRQVKFAKVHMFPYSPRKRTKAALFEDSVSDDLKAQRKNELLRLSEKMSFELRSNYVGKSLEILTENEASSSKTVGHSDNFLKVILKEEKIRPNELVKVLIVDNQPEGLIGTLI